MNTFKKRLVVLTIFSLLIVTKAPASVATVYVFMSETCPICQSATLALKSLYKEYHEKGIEFVAVFPNVNVSNQQSIDAFAKKYQLEFTMKLDEGQSITQKFSATITPQVFVERNSNQELFYSGMIDNGYVRVGKKRQVITEHYLKNALDEILSNKPVSIKATEPIGCFIIKN